MNKKILITITFSLLFCFSAEVFAGVYIRSRPAEYRLAFIIEEIEKSSPGTEERAVAVVKLEEFVGANPYLKKNSLALFTLAKIYDEDGDRKRAGKAFEKILRDYPDSEYSKDALYWMAFQFYVMGHLKEAEEILNSLVFDTTEPYGEAEVLLEKIKNVTDFVPVPSDEAEIGVLLRLEGVFAKYSEYVLNSVYLALDDFAKNNWKVKLRKIDHGMDGETAARAVGELASNPNVVGIIGPLFTNLDIPAVRAANRNNIPVVAISQGIGVPEEGEFAFRNFINPEAQAKTIAAYAVKTLELKSFAILHPDTVFGVEYSDHFAKEVEKLGGVIVGRESYEVNATDFGEQIKSLFAIEVEETMKGRQRITEYTSTVTADAIYIPDNYNVAGLIPAHLLYHDIEGLTLLGTKGWNTEKLFELGGETVEGAVFVDTFFPESERPETARFVKKFQKRYGYTPGTIEAEAYDTTMMMLLAISEGPVYRVGLKDALKKTKDYEGVCGSITFDANGEAHKDLFILTVKDGKIIPANGR